MDRLNGRDESTDGDVLDDVKHDDHIEGTGIQIERFHQIADARIAQKTAETLPHVAEQSPRRIDGSEIPVTLLSEESQNMPIAAADLHDANSAIR